MIQNIDFLKLVTTGLIFLKFLKKGPEALEQGLLHEMWQG
jgi:hypothetical protein